MARACLLVTVLLLSSGVCRGHLLEGVRLRPAPKLGLPGLPKEKPCTDTREVVRSMEFDSLSFKDRLPESIDKTSFLEFDFALPVLVVGWTTRGRAGFRHGFYKQEPGFVSTYMVTYITKTGKMQKLEHPLTSGGVVNLLKPVEIRSIRFTPLYWSGVPFLEVRLVICSLSMAKMIIRDALDVSNIEDKIIEEQTKVNKDLLVLQSDLTGQNAGAEDPDALNAKQIEMDAKALKSDIKEKFIEDTLIESDEDYLLLPRKKLKEVEVEIIAEEDTPRLKDLAPLNSELAIEAAKAIEQEDYDEEEVVLLETKHSREDETEMQSADDIMVDTWNGVPRGCRAKPADVYFVLDTASGTSDAAVQQQQQFLASLAALFPLSKTAVRVGIISVGHRPEVTARLGRKDKMADLQQAVRSTPRVGGLPDIAQALRYLRQRAFAPDTARKEVAHAVIMMTNGNSLNAKEAAAEAELLRGQGVYLYAVSTSADQKVDKTELMRLASQPADKFVYDTSDYNIVESLIDLLHVELCNYQVLPPIKTKDAMCASRRPTDVAFVVEHLGLGSPKTQRLLDFIQSMLSEMDPDSDIKAAIVTSEDPIPSSKVDTIQHLEQRLDKVVFPDLGTLLKRARKTLGHRVRGKEKVEDEEVQKVVVVFVDDSVEMTSHALEEARANKRNKLDTYVVVVGNLTKPTARLLHVANGSDHVIYVDSYDDLESQSVLSQVLTTLCRGL